ncbi:phosphoenolpyruvate--protein phosphotransferase [Facklamia sp. DSM 111018]|uniref:Phosphoenolpyruvate-protein phosphotransferase n=1 Tax=Facklamia lactis TaxID=2749967 RepID=A0ABS0LTE1_9LACT|nr:phosphoenolpyruvate--protein phosphotransferase [Facklamia lactis]MBG9980907.1 phosphoenolpyruvate--protein phosphotransferase [Facklamia lactis]MBG9986730.1 phosphoenolpyruvate--protein phosphotransferase [Facklamia lactis]
MTDKLTGIAASDGIAIAPVYLLVDPDLSFEKVSVTDTDHEQARLSAAVEQAKGEIEKIRQVALVQLGEAEAQVFDAHLLVLSDPEFLAQINQVIQEEKFNAEAALTQVSDMFVGMFEAMEDNPYMQERASDIRDVSQRILAALLGVTLASPSTIDEEVILVARDLTPSDTAQLNRDYVKAFVTNIGGRTSHSAIMARSLEIPAIVGTDSITQNVENGQMIIVDAIEGIIILEPTAEELAEYRQKLKDYQTYRKDLEQLIDSSSVSKDGVEIELAANIGTPKDVKGALANGADGIGLYRTEFLYMDASDFPTEEDQYQAYKEVLMAMENKGVVVRTMDIGGDKHLPYLQLPEEMNPFLGYRAIRVSLDQIEMFKTQLRALLRASIHGKLRIMFPMIATLEEFQQAKSIFEEVKKDLLSDGQDVADDIQVGIMIEIPAAAINADQLAKEVDFFSIGTNDLIQYTMAADRMNEKVSYLYQPYHPSILRLVKFVVESAHKEGKWAGMCGEMAGDQTAVPLLLGIGLDEFSMSASSILKTRKLISELDTKAMKELADRATTECANSSQVVDLVNEYISR